MIMVTTIQDGVWREPEVAPFSGRNQDIEPSISADGQRFFFLSTRPQPGQVEKPGWLYQDIWVMDREGDHWSEPYNLGPPVNSDAPEYFPSVTADGTLYFTREGEDSLGGVDYYVVFRSDDDTWSEPVNMGEAINQPEGREWSASLSPEGKYLFFMTSRAGGEAGLPLTGRSISDLLDISTRPGQGSSDIWWVSAEIIEQLRP